MHIKLFLINIYHEKEKRKKAVFSLLILICILVLMLLNWDLLFNNQIVNPLKDKSTEYLDETLQSAGAAFLISRALNGTISVLQSFTVSPFIGELSLGEILDPVNDLIERFSWVMLTVTVAVGIQKLLMEIGLEVNLTIVILPALMLLWVSLFLKTAKSKNWSRSLAYKLLIVAMLIRFAIPLIGLAGAHISSVFLDEKRDMAMQDISASQEQMSAITLQGAITDPRKILESLQEDTENIASQIIILITVFIFETILFPLLVLWGLVKLAGMLLLRFNIPSDKQ